MDKWSEVLLTFFSDPYNVGTCLGLLLVFFLFALMLLYSDSSGPSLEDGE